jgi:type II secretory pathway pseudopilin PulG
MVPAAMAGPPLAADPVMLKLNPSAGFSLLEALVAAALLAGGVTALAHLLARSAGQISRSEDVTLALVLAQAKLEQLRAAVYAFDEDGQRVDDGLLDPSAPDALGQDSPPHVEALDRFGAILADGQRPVFIRRWSIVPAALDPDTLTLGVCVRPTDRDAEATQTCVWTIRTRQP